jgi:hypothetical protein
MTADIVKDFIQPMMMDVREDNHWDVEPSFGMVVINGDGSYRLSPMEQMFHLESLSDAPVELHVMMYFKVLTSFVSSKPEAFGRMARDLMAEGTQIVGVYLLNEGWALRSTNKSPAEIKQLGDWAKSHNISDHPDRIETRLFTLVGFDEVAYMVTDERDSAAEIEVFTSDNAKDPVASGRVLEAMKETATVMKESLFA